jgi:hypothetical protein
MHRPAPQATAKSGFALERPFNLIVVLWGERFRNYFLDLCLPSLLSAGNLPALSTARRSKFQIWTRPDDWTAIKASPIFASLERCIDPVFGEIPPCPPGVSGHKHMGFGHRHGLEMAFQAKAYTFLLTPDSIFPDGTVGRLQDLAVAGNELVLAAAQRFAEEPFFRNLQKLGIVPHHRSGAAEPICLGVRELVRAALTSMHSETLAYEWDAAYFVAKPWGVWWRVPGEEGVVMHSFSWAAPLIDMAAVKSHDTSTFDDWTFDGDYVYRNLGHSKRIHVVTDSDELFVVSWGPSADRPYSLKSRALLRLGPLSALIKYARFRDWFYSGIFDHLKEDTFFCTVRWHAEPLNERWYPVEQRALRILLSCVARPTDHTTNPFKLLLDMLRAAYLPARILLFWVSMVKRLWSDRSTILLRVNQICRGDRAARKRVIWRISQIAHLAVGLKFNAREPSAPE